ncbi:MAG: hypothetical protein AB1801_25375, partial [Chloroflexota bacterium]
MNTDEHGNRLDGGRRWSILAWLMLFLLACGGGLPFPLAPPSPTQPAVIINFGVTLVKPFETPTPT